MRKHVKVIMQRQGAKSYWINIFKVFLTVVSLFCVTNFRSFAQSPVVVWSENWDNATDPQDWTYRSAGWWDGANISLASSAGHGQVLKVYFPGGTTGSGSGLGNYRIPLDSAYKELYVSFDYFIPSSFSYTKGKLFAGLAGGSYPNIPHVIDHDTTGWSGALMFEQAGYYHTYNYFSNGNWFDNGDGTSWPNGDYLDGLAKGSWHNITQRYKMNDPYDSNGIYEVFDNGKLIYQQTNVKFANDVHPDFDIIDAIYLNDFFGGGASVPAGGGYFEFDNLEAYYYPVKSPDYRPGASEAGRTITIPTATNYHPTPPDIFNETTYTAASGRIRSHCAYYIACDHLGFQTSTINVNGATSLTLNVTNFTYDGGLSSESDKQILNIYQGTGTNKTLIKTFENGVYTTVPTTITIPGNTATIEWQAGYGTVKTFSLYYSSDGTGSGSNFTCGNYTADQGGIASDITHALTISNSGNGSVTPGSGNYPANVTINLTATPASGWAFDSWSGDTTATIDPLPVKIWKDKNLTANFTQLSSYGTIAYWRFENNALDETGNHDATLYGSPTFDASAAEGSYALNLNTSSGQYASGGNITLGNSFSVSGYIKIYGSSGVRPIFATTSSSSPDGILAQVDLSTGQFSLVTGDGTSQVTATSTTGNFTSGAWVKFEYDIDRTNNTCSIKINDVDVSNSTSIVGDFTDDKVFYMGQDAAGTSRIWGEIDAFKILGDVSTTYNLTTSVSGSGSINPFSGTYTANTITNLTATPASGWAFYSWSGDTTATIDPLPVKMWKDKNITANFTQSSGNGTIAYWRFENNALDETGNHDATLYGSPTFDASAAEGSYALDLNTSSGQYASGGNITLGNSFSVSGYIKIYGSSGVRPIFATTSSSTPDGILAQVDLSTGQFSLVTGDGTSQATATSTTGNFTSGSWVKFEYDIDRTNNTCSIKINGVDVSNSTSIVGDFTDNKVFYMGQDAAGISRIWGEIDAFKIQGEANTTYNLTTSVTGSGSITPSSGTYTANTITNLTASPAQGWAFDSWGGDTTATTNPLPVKMWRNKNITVTFSQIPSTIAYWRFENNALDETGNHDATLYGSPTFDASAAEGSYALNLNTSSGQYASGGNITLGNSFSVSGYIKIYGSSGVRPIFATTSSSSPDGILAQVDLSTGQFSLVTGDGTSQVTATSTAGNFTSGSWVKFEYDIDRTNNTCSIKINDVDVSNSTSIVGDFTDDKVFYMGQDAAGISRIWGEIDAFKIVSPSPKSAVYKLPEVGNQEQIKKNDIKYYPVPVTNYLTLANLNTNGIISVFDMLGNKILELNNGNSAELRLNLSSFKKGIYVIRIMGTADNTIDNFKIVKQ